MRKKTDDDQHELESEVGFTGPVQLRRGVRGSGSRSRVTSRRKAANAGTTRRKNAKPGGMHQRSNRRIGW